MTKTTQDLAERVLLRLKVTGAGETPNNDDASLVKNFYATTFAEIEVLELTYWPVASIPDEAFEALADFIAGRIGPDFGKDRPDLEASGRQRLAVLSAQGPTGRIVTAPFF